MNNQDINDLTSQISDLLNKPKKQYELLQDSNKWSQLWVCVNTINDIGIMLNNYLQLEIDLEDSNYRILIYGILQGLYIQQDAIENLFFSLSKDEQKNKTKRQIDWKNDYPEIYKIRNIRNNYAGHPTSNANGFYQIHPNFITLDDFTVLSYLKDGSFSIETLNIKELIAQQNNIVILILQNLIKEIEESELKHKQQFQNESLFEIIKGVDYGLSKLSELYHEDIYGNVEWSRVSFVSVKNIYNNFISLLIKRFDSLEALDSMEYLKMKIDWDIKKIDDLFNNNNFKDNLDTYVYSEHLKSLFSELKQIAKEIDEEYSIE